MSTKYRQPVAAGTFYPKDCVQLTRLADNYLKGAFTGRPLILIVPHAGYVYSGAVAGAAFVTASDFDTVILVGVSHHCYFSDARLSAVDSWVTPLGEVTLNQAVITKLLEHHPIFQTDESVHAPEHGLEVQVPFLQRQLPGCTIVPVLLSHLSPEACQQVAAGLISVLEERTLLVISSDLCHYPIPDDAEWIDGMTIQAILRNDMTAFDCQLQLPVQRTIRGLETCACGSLAIKIGMSIAATYNLGNGHLLHYANSGTPSGAVGYAAIGYLS